jgi:hypothetical protein
MVAVTWLGDEDPRAQQITQYGHVFVKGEPTEVPAKDPFMGKFKAMSVFAVGKDGDVVESEEPEAADPDDGTEIAAVRKDLDELGVKYHPNAKLDTLRAKLADALG